MLTTGISHDGDESIAAGSWAIKASVRCVVDVAMPHASPHVDVLGAGALRTLLHRK